VDSPESRVHKIWSDGPDNNSNQSDAGKAALAVAGTNQYYTWNQISQNVPNYSDAQFNTSYSTVIPDGKLASGNNVAGSNLNFAGLDLVSSTWEWPATTVAAGAFTVNWKATAPHDPSYFKIWITKEGYDTSTPLEWGKLDYLGQYSGAQVTKTGLNYSIPITLPARTGRHVLYVAWQRIDPVGEVFFSASDIIFGGGGGSGGGSDPTVSVADATVNENDGTATVTVTLSHFFFYVYSSTVFYTTNDATATQPSDYTTATGSLSFAAGELTKTFTVPLINDSTEESVELFTVALSNIVGVDAGDTSATITINDDDTTLQGGWDWATRDDWGSGYNGWLTIANGSSTAVTNGTLTITVSEGQSVNYFGGTATQVAESPNDPAKDTYTISGINIPANGSIQLDIGFSNATGAVRGPLTVLLNGSLLDKLPPAVSIADVTKAEGDVDGSVDLTVTLSKAHTSDIHFSYITVDGTATAGTDYTAKSGNLVFTAGQVTKTITIDHVGNTVDEIDKTFTVALAGVNGQTTPRFATDGNMATVTLSNDDGPIKMTATGGIIHEGDNGNTNLTFRLFLDRDVKLGETVSVHYATHGHGATPSADFVPTSGTYTFLAGSNTGTIDVPVIGDTVDERHEYFMLHFTQPVGISLSTTEAVGQILDDEFNKDNLGNQRVIAYLDGTSGTLNIPPADRVTHIMYAFANLNTDGTLNIGASVPAQLVTLNNLKTTNPDLKVLLSVGGWTWSSNFSAVAADSAKRTAFANSCVAAVNTHGLDGIDVDWEWPGVSGGPGTSPTPQDGANYTLLLQALRAALDANGSSQNPTKHYEISAFTAASPAGIAALELQPLSQVFDFVNAQGYDLHGAWNSRTGHNAGLYHNSADPQDNRLNIDSVLAQYLAGGFRRDQLLVGAPFYTQDFSNVENTANGLFQTSASIGGQTLYKDLTTKLQTQVRYWDAVAKVPYLYNANTKAFTSYDDPMAMHHKALYSRDKGFGGIFFWRNGGDTNDRQLLNSISDSLSFVDSDNDTLDDEWEMSIFGNLTDANATTDNDNDGASDKLEHDSKTDPKNTNEHLKAEVTGTDATGTTIQFPSKLGVRYKIQTSETLIGGSWADMGSIMEGTDAMMTYKDTIHPQSEIKRFYRVVTVD